MTDNPEGGGEAPVLPKLTQEEILEKILEKLEALNTKPEGSNQNGSAVTSQTPGANPQDPNDFSGDKLEVDAQKTVQLESSKRKNKRESTRSWTIGWLLAGVLVGVIGLSAVEVITALTTAKDDLSPVQRESAFKLISLLPPMLSFALGFYFAKEDQD
jgi:hypothetical protein